MARVRSAVTGTSGGKIEKSLSSSGSQGSGQGGPYVERVSITNNANAIQLSRGLPPLCRVKWVTMRNITAVTVPDGGATGTADGFALVKLSAVSAIDETANTSVMCQQTTLTADAEAASGSAVGAGAAQLFENNTTSEIPLFIVPIDSGGGQYHETSTTNGYAFSGTATIDVMVDIEQYRMLNPS